MDEASAKAILALPSSRILLKPANFSELTNDEDRIKCVLQLLLDNNAIPETFIMRKKNNETARNYLILGIALRDDNKVKEAAQAFTAAIVHVLPDSKLQDEAYFSRSKISFLNRYYDHALLDIDRCLRTGCKCPAFVYAQRAYVLTALNYGKINPEAQEFINKALESSIELSEKAQKELKQHLSLLETNFMYLDAQKFFDHNSLIPEKPEENNKIVGASNAIELKYSEKYGRHIVATRDIKVGEALSIHKFYVSIPGDQFEDGKPENIYRCCWNCSNRIISGVACHQCVNVIYCNEECRNTAWIEHHDIECPIINVMMVAGMKHKELMALRMTVLAYKEAGSLEALKEMINKIDSNKGKCRYFFLLVVGNYLVINGE